MSQCCNLFLYCFQRFTILTGDSSRQGRNMKKKKRQPRKVAYPAIGYGDAREYWEKEVLPVYAQFKNLPNHKNALSLASRIWDLHDRAWHDNNPNVEPRDNANGYQIFSEHLLKCCPALGLIRDVAESIKHAGLSRPSVKVKGIEGVGSPGGKIQHFKAFGGMEEYPPRGQLDL